MVKRTASYSSVDKQVVVTDRATGIVLWHGKPDDTAVAEVLAIPDTSDAVVLLDYMAKEGAFQNLVRIGPDGAIRWRAELPTTDTSEAYVNVDYNAERGCLVANSWTGHQVVLAPASGAIIEMSFVK